MKDEDVKSLAMALESYGAVPPEHFPFPPESIEDIAIWGDWWEDQGEPIHAEACRRVYVATVSPDKASDEQHSHLRQLKVDQQNMIDEMLDEALAQHERTTTPKGIIGYMSGAVTKSS